MTILRAKRWILIAPVGLILVLGLVLFIMPGPGTTYAKPTLDVMHIDTTFGDICVPQAELEWSGSQFANRDGFRKVVLYRDNELVFKGPPFRISAGTDGENGIVLIASWEHDPTANYSYEVSFYWAQGENGASDDSIGRLLMSVPGASSTC